MDETIKMHCGTLNCHCGQTFWFETVNPEINCITCNAPHDITSYPFKEDPIEEIEFTEEVTPTEG